jgi:hypothetical protein
MSALDPFRSSALIEQESLGQIVAVLEAGWPAGPTFFNALSTLTESLCLYDHVYFDPIRMHLGSDAPPGARMLQESPLVRLLVSEGALELFPDRPFIDAALAEEGRDYDYLDFLTDYVWTTNSAFWAEPDGERGRLQLYSEIVDSAYPLLTHESLVPEVESSLVFGPESLMLLLGRQLRLSNDDLIFLEGLNHHSRALFTLCRNLRIHLQPFYLSQPHHLGTLDQNNSRAVTLYRQLLEEIEKRDRSAAAVAGQTEAPEQSGFQRVSLPALVGQLLDRCVDQSNAIGPELLELRRRRARFRSYVREFDQRWSEARTKEQLWDLGKEWNAAITKMGEKQDRPSTRLIYIIWDILKDPVKMLQAVGDKLAARGREECIIRRVDGLHDFWRDLAKAPADKVTTANLARLFPKRLDDEVWDLAGKLADSLDRRLPRDDATDAGVAATPA